MDGTRATTASSSVLPCVGLKIEAIQTRSQYPGLNSLSFAHGILKTFASYYTSFGGRP